MPTLSFQAPLWLVVCHALGLGLLIGSFLNVVVYRLPIMLARQWAIDARTELGLPSAPELPRLNLSVPRRSCCPVCNHQISAWENIPLISFLALRGKCSSCRVKISIRYPVVELSTGLLFAAVAWRFGLSPQTVGLLILTGLLIPIGLIDSEHQLIPDCLTQPLLWIGLLLNSSGVFVVLSDAVWGAVIGYVGLWSISSVFTLLSGKQGMGHGDFKLLAALGAWGGWQQVPAILYGACVIGCAFYVLRRFRDGHSRVSRLMPFGPCLAVMGWLALVCDQSIRDVVAILLGQGI